MLVQRVFMEEAGHMTLSERIRIWRGMPQDTAEEQLWADNYYDNELMPRALQYFARHYGRQRMPEYYGMILIMGNAWEDLAFNVGLLSPQNIHVICTQEHVLQYRQLVQNLQLEEDRCICTRILDGDIASLYRVMKKQHDIWDSMGRSAVDITGGTMESAPAAAMAATALDMDVYRLIVQKNSALGRHEPGSERMLKLLPVKSVLAQ